MTKAERLRQTGRDILESLGDRLVLESHASDLPSPLAGKYLKQYLEREAQRRGIRGLVVNYNPQENYSCLFAKIDPSLAISPRTRQTAAQFRSPAQYKLVRAMDRYGHRIGFTQGAFDDFKLGVMNDRKTEKGEIISRLMGYAGWCGLPDVEIADIPGVSTAFARQLLNMGMVNVAQLAEFNVTSPKELLRYRNLGKVKVERINKTILRPCDVPYLHKLSDGFAEIGRDVNQLSPRALDVLASSKFDLMDLMHDASLSGIRHHALDAKDIIHAWKLIEGFQGLPFTSDFVLVSRRTL